MSDASDHDAGVRISVIDSNTRDDNGFLARERALHPNYIGCHDVRSMVANVLHRAGGRKIARLRIYGHGHEGSQRVGGGQKGDNSQRFWIDQRGILHHRDLLSLWRNHFTRHAVVQLHGCEVGAGWEGRKLLRDLALMWHVRTMAAVKEQHALAGSAFEGRYIEADGSIRNVPVHVHDTN